MGKKLKEQVPARAIFVHGSLWVWSATSRGRPPDAGMIADGGLFTRSKNPSNELRALLNLLLGHRHVF